MSPQLLIVGAGPTGLALACRCRQLGLDVRVIDRKSAPSTTSKAIGLQYRVSEVLHLLGVADRFAAESASPMSINMNVGARQMLRFQFRSNARAAGRDAFQPRMFIIPQSRTEALLAEHLAGLGAGVEWGTELLDHGQTPQGVEARLRRADGSIEIWSGRWLVSCEGAHSVVRRQAGVEFQGKTYPINALLADVSIENGPPGDEVHVWLHPEGSAALMPMPGGVWRCMVEVTGPDADRRIGEDEVWPIVRDALQQRVPGAEGWRFGSPHWASQFRIHARMVDRFRVGNVFLAGDAAHIHSPNGGQGITTGVQDAVNLAWKLSAVARGAPDELLDTYEAERRPQAAAVLHHTDRMTKLFFATSPLRAAFREWILLPVLRSEWFQRVFFGALTQLNVSYRGGPLAREEANRPWLRWGWPRSGDRCPDVVFEHPGGERLSLLELLRPGRPVVLFGRVQPELVLLFKSLDLESYCVVPSRDGSVSDPRTLIDVHGDWRRLYGLGGDFACVVRPDGHLGLVQAPLQFAALRSYLTRLGCQGQREEGRLSLAGQDPGRTNP